MFKSIFVVTALVAATFAQSNTATASSTVSQSMPAVATQGFNIALVNSTTKATWCQNQRVTCPDVCGRTTSNDCDPTTLNYACVCFNGTEPDLSAYTQTIPFFVCQETYAQCISEHQNDTDAQTSEQQCTDNHKCGSLNAQANNGVQVSSTATSSSATGSASGSATAASSSSSHAGAMGIAPAANGAFAALLFALWRLV